MKRYLPLILLGILIIAFLFIKNENYRKEVEELNIKVEKLTMDEEIIYSAAGSLAEEFINGYFNFDGKPNKNKIEKIVSKEKLQQLSFSSIDEYDENLETVISNVRNLEIYYGNAVKNKQKILGIFLNEIEVDGVETTVRTFIDLDIKKVNESWKIVDFQFYQI